MSILHYTLGFPPKSVGGLTTFSIDLSIFQSNKDDVFVLWPGRFKILNRKSKLKIKKTKFSKKLFSVEILNPLPVSLFGGINNFDLYEKNLDIDFITFFSKYNIKKIYIHTFMGMPKKLLTDAKKNRIEVIYVTHNYFPMCPKTTLFYNSCTCNPFDKRNCEMCCKNAFSKKTIFLLQSNFYSKIKRFPIINYFRNKILSKQSRINGPLPINDNASSSSKNNYIKLQNFYLVFFQFIDKIICNSFVSEKIYSQVIPNGNYQVLPLTHASIKDNRHIKRIHADFFVFGFLSPETEEKGFDLLIRVLDKFYAENHKFKLVVYSSSNNRIARDYLEFKGSYQYNELSAIYETIDCTIVPSVWEETYGFSVLESLSNGVPTIASSNVGASMLLCKENIFDNERELLSLLESIDKEKLLEMNFQICNDKKLGELIKNGLSSF